MPKLRQRTRPAPTMDDHYRAALAGRIALMRFDTYAEAVDHSGLTEATFYKRRKYPATMSIGELRSVAKAFGFNARQICAIIGVPYETKENTPA